MEVGGIRIEGEEPHASKVLAMEDASYLQHEEVEMEWGEAPSGRILTEFAVDSRGMLWFFGGMISGCHTDTLYYVDTGAVRGVERWMVAVETCTCYSTAYFFCQIPNDGRIQHCCCCALRICQVNK